MLKLRGSVQHLAGLRYISTQFPDTSKANSRSLSSESRLRRLVDVRRRRERTSVQKVADKFHNQKRVAHPDLGNTWTIYDNAQGARKPKEESALSPQRGHVEADQAGRARQASRVPARPASPGSPSRAPSRGCGKASRSAQLNRFPVPPAPAPRLPAAQDKPSALHPPVPRSRPRGSAPSRGESLPNRLSKDRATGWVALKPYLQGGWRRHRGKSPRLGLLHRPVLSRETES